jgi:rSAM/selenodomain-associated transferase 2
VAEPLPDQPRISIVIPVLNEASCLDQNLTRLFRTPGVSDHCEVIVCDGGSADNSLEVIQRHPCQVVHSNSGRAMQMNTGAEQAQGKWLLFLHADSVLPNNFINAIGTSSEWGFFRLRLDDDAFVYRIIESAINLRTRFSRVAGGDQGLYFNRRFFESINGFPQIPLMEDLAICKSARRRASPKLIPAALTSSNRRWREQGVVKTVLLMWSLRLAYWLGVDPQRLHRIYYPSRS